MVHRDVVAVFFVQLHMFEELRVFLFFGGSRLEIKAGGVGLELFP